MIEGALSERIALFPLPDVAAYGKRTLTGLLFDSFGEGQASVFLSAGDDDVRAAAGDGEDPLSTDSAAAACDKGDHAVEAKLLGGIEAIAHGIPAERCEWEAGCNGLATGRRIGD